MDWIHQIDWLGMLPSVDTLMSVNDVEPLLLAAPIVPIAVKIFGLFKLQIKRKDRKKTTSETTTPTDPIRSVSSVSITRIALKVLFLFYCGTLLGIAGVLSVWKGCLPTVVSIVLLYITMRQTTRSSFLFDLSFAVFGTLSLSLLTTIPVTSKDTLVSVDVNVAAYRSIKDAMTHTPEGGIVRILPGVYKENIFISKNIVLQGLGATQSDVVIASPNSLPTVVIAGDGRMKWLTLLSKNTQPALIFADSVLGAHISDVMVNCSGSTRSSCVASLRSHPLVLHHLTNISINSKLLLSSVVDDESSPETVSIEQSTVISNTGVVQLTSDVVTSDSTNAYIHSATPRHLASVSVVVRWLDASAHWLLIATNHISVFVKIHVSPRMSIVMIYIRRYGKTVGEMIGMGLAATAHVVGVGIQVLWNVLYSGWGMIHRHGGHVVVQVMSQAGNVVWVTLLSLCRYFIAILPSLLGILSSYLNENQLIQLALHLLSLLVTLLVFFSGNIRSIMGGGYLQASLTLSRNLPTAIPILIEYGISLFVFICCYSILPVFLPFINVYITMAVVHVGLPVQSTYTVLKRFQSGLHFRHKSWWITLLMFRIFTLLHPTKVFVVFFVLYLLLQGANGKGKESKEEDKKSKTESAESIDEKKKQ